MSTRSMIVTVFVCKDHSQTTSAARFYWVKINNLWLTCVRFHLFIPFHCKLNVQLPADSRYQTRLLIAIESKFYDPATSIAKDYPRTTETEMLTRKSDFTVFWAQNTYEEDQWRNVILYILKLIHSLETGVRNGNWNCPVSGKLRPMKIRNLWQHYKWKTVTGNEI